MRNAVVKSLLLTLNRFCRPYDAIVFLFLTCPVLACESNVNTLSVLVCVMFSLMLQGLADISFSEKRNGPFYICEYFCNSSLLLQCYVFISLCSIFAMLKIFKFHFAYDFTIFGLGFQLKLIGWVEHLVGSLLLTLKLICTLVLFFII